MSANKLIYLRIRRQTSPKDKSYWEDFILEFNQNDTLLSLLLRIANDPKTSDGKKTTPIHHEYNCKEEICGTCTVRINGRPVMSCSTLLINLPASSSEKPIIVEPLEKFPIVRDLTVNRNKVFQSLSSVKNWVEVDELFGPPLKYAQNEQLEMYSYSKCINCGSCYDSCPRTERSSKSYLGPAAITQVTKMCIHPLGRKNRNNRLASIMSDNGISKCGKALICEKVCPKSVPLVQSITRANREAIKALFHLH